MGHFVSLPMVRTQFLSVAFPSLCISNSFNSAAPSTAPILLLFYPSIPPTTRTWSRSRRRDLPRAGAGFSTQGYSAPGRGSPQGSTTPAPTLLPLSFPGLLLAHGPAVIEHLCHRTIFLLQFNTRLLSKKLIKPDYVQNDMT